MTQRIILGTGTGRCGSFSLARLLNQQPGVQVSHEDPPLLPWEPVEGRGGCAEAAALMPAGTQRSAQLSATRNTSPHPLPLSQRERGESDPHPNPGLMKTSL